MKTIDELMTAKPKTNGFTFYPSAKARRILEARKKELGVSFKATLNIAVVEYFKPSSNGSAFTRWSSAELSAEIDRRLAAKAEQIAENRRSLDLANARDLEDAK